MKKCFKCGIEKELNDFYKHSKMSDGHLNKCKDCTKKDISIRYIRLTSTKEGRERERERGREKYYRLNYKEKLKQPSDKKLKINHTYFSKFPEKYMAKKINYGVKTPPGFERHHWSYNTDHLRDVIFLTTKDHNLLHRFMIYDQERLMYRKLNGELLDSKESNINLMEEIRKI